MDAACHTVELSRGSWAGLTARLAVWPSSLAPRCRPALFKEMLPVAVLGDKPWPLKDEDRRWESRLRGHLEAYCMAGVFLLELRLNSNA